MEGVLVECETCGQRIAADARRCPGCGGVPETARTRMRYQAATIAIAVVLLAILAAVYWSGVHAGR